MHILLPEVVFESIVLDDLLRSRKQICYVFITRPMARLTLPSYMLLM